MGKPEIRFKGYTDEWEQRKLGEVTQCLDSERVPINSEEREKIPGEIPYYGAGNIQGYINKFLFDEELVLLLEDGDAFDDFRTKEIAQYICGKTWVNNHAHVLRPLGDAYFLYITLSHKDIRNWVQLAGASRKKLVQKSMLNIELFMPHIIEQKKIGQYFSNLDHLITLHQRKCDEIKSLKKYMLQKMFPQNEQKVPKIRFKGFTEAWEQRKFGDYNDLMTGYPFESDKFSEDGIKLVRGMNVKRGYLDFSEDICVKWNSCVGSENYLLKDGDILIQMDGALIGKSYAKIKKNQLPALLVQRVTRARTNNKLASQDFMYQTIQRDFLRYIGMNKTETAVPHLSLNDIRNFEIMVPGLAEQNKIGTYFSNLDRLITLHQQKCEELKKIKKFMLQKMFV